MDLLEISRIGLGTAQFGFDYGVNNTAGRVSYDEVCRILITAAENGINFLDTSRFYGVSEEVLGKAMEETGLEFMVCTKLDLPDNYKDMDRGKVKHAVLECFDKSCEALRLNKIPMYLLHNYENYKAHDGYIWSLLSEIRDSGRIDVIGLSISGGPDEASECLEDPDMGAIQIPFNVFDQRWKRETILERCREKGVVLINRSTYLQGLLLMEPEKAAERVPVSEKNMRNLNKLSRESGIGVKELVFRYVIANPFINTTIVGVDSLDQLEENIRLQEKGSLPMEIIEKIELMYKDPMDELVNPSYWVKVPYNP